MLKLDDDERVSDILPVNDFSDEQFIYMATKKGTNKKSNLSFLLKSINQELRQLI